MCLMIKTNNNPLSAIAGLATDKPRHEIRTDCVSVEPATGRVRLTAGSESVAASIDVIARGTQPGSGVLVDAHELADARGVVRVVDGVVRVDRRELPTQDGRGVGRELIPGVRSGSAKVRIGEMIRLLRAAAKVLGKDATIAVDARPLQGSVVVAGSTKDRTKFFGACRAVPADGDQKPIA